MLFQFILFLNYLLSCSSFIVRLYLSLSSNYLHRILYRLFLCSSTCPNTNKKVYLLDHLSSIIAGACLFQVVHGLEAPLLVHIVSRCKLISVSRKQQKIKRTPSFCVYSNVDVGCVGCLCVVVRIIIFTAEKQLNECKFLPFQWSIWIDEFSQSADTAALNSLSHLSCVVSRLHQIGNSWMLCRWTPQFGCQVSHLHQ